MYRALHGVPPRLARSSSALLGADLSLPGGCSSTRSRLSSRYPYLRRETLLQLVLDLVQAGMGTGIVEIATGRPGRADRSDHLVAHLDNDASAEQQQMRQFEQVRQHRYRLRPFNKRGRVGLERCRRVGLEIGAVEGMGASAITAQHRLLHSIGIDQHTGLYVTLTSAFRDNGRHRLVCEIRGDAVRLEQTLGVGLANEKSGAERG